MAFTYFRIIRELSRQASDNNQPGSALVRQKQLPPHIADFQDELRHHRGMPGDAERLERYLSWRVQKQDKLAEKKECALAIMQRLKDKRTIQNSIAALQTQKATATHLADKNQIPKAAQTLLDEYTTLAATIISIKQRLGFAAAEKELAALRSENQALNERHTTLSAKLKEQKQKRTHYRTSLQDTNTKLTELEEQLKVATARKNDLNDRKVALDPRRQELKNQNADLNQRHKSLSSQKKRQEQHLLDTRNELARIEKSRKLRGADHTALDDKEDACILRKQQHKQALRDCITSLVPVNADLDELHQLEKKWFSLDKKYASASSDIAALNKKMSEHRATRDQTTSLQQDLEQAISKRDAAIAENRQHASSVTDKISALEQRFATWNEQELGDRIARRKKIFAKLSPLGIDTLKNKLANRNAAQEKIRKLDRKIAAERDKLSEEEHEVGEMRQAEAVLQNQAAYIFQCLQALSLDIKDKLEAIRRPKVQYVQVQFDIFGNVVQERAYQPISTWQPSHLNRDDDGWLVYQYDAAVMLPPAFLRALRNTGSLGQGCARSFIEGKMRSFMIYAPNQQTQQLLSDNRDYPKQFVVPAFSPFYYAVEFLLPSPRGWDDSETLVDSDDEDEQPRFDPEFKPERFGPRAGGGTGPQAHYTTRERRPSYAWDTNEQQDHSYEEKGSSYSSFPGGRHTFKEDEKIVPVSEETAFLKSKIKPLRHTGKSLRLAGLSTKLNADELASHFVQPLKNAGLTPTQLTLLGEHLDIYINASTALFQNNTQLANLLKSYADSKKISIKTAATRADLNDNENQMLEKNLDSRRQQKMLDTLRSRNATAMLKKYPRLKKNSDGDDPNAAARRTAENEYAHDLSIYCAELTRGPDDDGARYSSSRPEGEKINAPVLTKARKNQLQRDIDSLAPRKGEDILTRDEKNQVIQSSIRQANDNRAASVESSEIYFLKCYMDVYYANLFDGSFNDLELEATTRLNLMKLKNKLKA